LIKKEERKKKGVDKCVIHIRHLDLDNNSNKMGGRERDLFI